MICARCKADSQVLDSRPTAEGAIRRRRQCANGHRFTTWESRQRPDTRDRAAYHAARYAAKPPEAKQRASLRAKARAEAKRTGEPAEAIYQRWDVA